MKQLAYRLLIQCNRETSNDLLTNDKAVRYRRKDWAAFFQNFFSFQLIEHLKIATLVVVETGNRKHQPLERFILADK